MDDDKLTIVGPRTKTPQKSVNVEALLLMAKYDDDFRQKLFSDREKALKESGIDFTPGEKLLLANITDEQLAENIDEFRVPGVTKRSLATWTKAAAVVLLLTTVMLSGFADARVISKGSVPDRRKKRTIISYTQVGYFTPEMKKIISEIDKKIKANMKIDHIIQDYYIIINKESKLPDKEKTIKTKSIELIKEIEEKIKAGEKTSDIIRKYEHIISFQDKKVHNVTVDVCMGIGPDDVRKMREAKEKEQEKEKEKEFTKVSKFTLDTIKVLSDIKKRSKSGESISYILLEYNSIIMKELDVPDKEKTIKPEVVEFIIEIDKKIKTGFKTNDVIKKYEELMGIVPK